MQAVWVKRITPRAWNMFRIALLHESMSRIVQKTTSYSRKEKTLTTHRALCPDGFSLIDDPLQLWSRNSHVLEYIRH